jgi:hypothetical protein
MMTYTYCDCDVEEAMFDVGSKRSQKEEKILNLRTENLCKLQIKRTVIDDQNCSETSVTGNLPQLNDPTMISVGTMVMVMVLLQYSQSDMH